MEMGCLNIMQNRPDNRIYAGFFVRLAAYIVDTVIVWAAMLIVRLPVWVTTISSPDNFLVKDFIFQYSIKDILLSLIHILFCESYFILILDIHKLFLAEFIISINRKFIDMFKICNPVITNLICNPLCKQQMCIRDRLQTAVQLLFLNYLTKIYMNLNLSI